MTKQDPQSTDPISENTIQEELENIVAEESPSASQDDEISRLRESLARSQADYQNLLMRVDRDKADMVSFLSGKILTPLLTQVDNLERAVKHKEGVEGDGFID